MSLLRPFEAGHAFPLKHLINQAIVRFRGEDEFTDSTWKIVVHLENVDPLKWFYEFRTSTIQFQFYLISLPHYGWYKRYTLKITIYK